MKYVGIGCLGIIVILLFSGCAGLLLLSVSDSESGNSNETEVVEENGNEAETEVDDSGAELTVGDSYTIDDITVTVNESYYTDERNQFADPVDSVIVVNLTYENNTGEDISVGMDFQLYADGAKMETYPIDSILGSVSDGRTVTGDVAYGLQGNPDEIELEFEPVFSFSGDKGIFDVKPQ